MLSVVVSQHYEEGCHSFHKRIWRPASSCSQLWYWAYALCNSTHGWHKGRLCTKNRTSRASTRLLDIEGNGQASDSTEGNLLQIQDKVTFTDDTGKGFIPCESLLRFCNQDSRWITITKRIIDWVPEVVLQEHVVVGQWSCHFQQGDEVTCLPSDLPASCLAKKQSFHP